MKDQKLSLGQQAGVLLLCLPSEDLERLLSKFNREEVSQIIRQLHLLERLTIFEKEAVLIEINEQILIRKHLDITDSGQVHRFLMQALGEADLVRVVQGAAMDRAEWMRPARRLHPALSQSSIQKCKEVLHGIRLRLQESRLTHEMHTTDSFYEEMLANVQEFVRNRPALVVTILRNMLGLEQNIQTSQDFQLNGRQKAALIMLILGPHIVRDFFDNMGMEEKQALVFEMSSLGPISDEQQLHVLTDFIDLLLSLELVPRDQVDYARELLDWARLPEWNAEQFIQRSDFQAREWMDLIGQPEPMIADDNLDSWQSNVDDILEDSLENEVPYTEVELDHSQEEQVRSELVRLAGLAATSYPRLVARAVRFVFRRGDDG